FRMGLTAGCSTKTDCTGDQTCVEGTCQSIEIDQHQLPEFTEDLVTELTCTSGATYIDTATGAPMRVSEDAGACPRNLCHEGTCLKPPPNGSGDMPDAGTVMCGDPIGNTCFGTTSSVCGCDAMCGSRTKSIRCEVQRCTCTVDGMQVSQFDRPETMG